MNINNLYEEVPVEKEKQRLKKWSSSKVLSQNSDGTFSYKFNTSDGTRDGLLKCGITLREYLRVHKYIRNKYGSANKCEMPDCAHKSNRFHWSIKSGRKYSTNPEDYIQLCAACHLKYDMTKDRIESYRKAQCGQTNNRAKLTNKDVLEIHELLKSGSVSINKIAAIYKISPTVIHNIKTGKRWAHLHPDKQTAITELITQTLGQ